MVENTKSTYFSRQIICVLNQFAVIIYLGFIAYNGHYIESNYLVHFLSLSLLFFDAAYISYKNVKCNKVLNHFSLLLLLLGWQFLLYLFDFQPISKAVSMLLLPVCFYQSAYFIQTFLFQGSAYRGQKALLAFLKISCVTAIICFFFSDRAFFTAYQLQFFISTLALVVVGIMQRKRIVFVLKSQRKRLLFPLALVVIPFVIYLFVFHREAEYIVKGTSLDTRHDLKLSFPPSDFSKTDDPVSLTYEGCYKAVGYYTAIINASPELKAAFIEAMAQHGIDADNCNELLKREWDIWAYLLSLPEIAELTKSMPAYEDYNRSKPENRSLISAARKIEHTKNGAIVEKVSIETGGPKDENGKATPLEIASSDDMVAEITDRIMVQQCLSLLSETDREILIRHANGETYAALANAYGYKTAGGMQKRIARIKKQVVNQMGANAK